jgi:twitching motility two-component system response regulator PilG
MSHTQFLRHAIDAAKAGNPALSKVHLQKAAEVAPDDPAVWLWMGWLSDSPLSMIQCLESVVQNEQFKDVAEAGLVFARTLAAFRVEEFTQPQTATSQSVSVAKAAESIPAPDLSSIETAVEEAAREVVEAPSIGDVQDSTESTSQATISEVANEPTANVSILDGTATTLEETPSAFVESVASAEVKSPALRDSSANVWRAAQSDWFSLDSDQQPAPVVEKALEPVTIVEPVDDADSVESPENEAEVVIPRIPSILPQQATTVEVQLAEQAQSVDPTQSLTGAVLAPCADAAENSWQSSPGPIVAPRIDSDSEPTQSASNLASLSETTRQTEASSDGTPLDPAAEFDAIAGQAYGQFEQDGSEKSEVILVVDDSPTVRKLIAMTLEKRGYKVASAFDGVAAIKEIAGHNPALILMDVNMPRLDGYQLCKLVKKHNSTRHIPVIMLTGKDGMFDRLRGRLVGCSGYISKPFVPDELVATVEQFLAAARKKR